MLAEAEAGKIGTIIVKKMRHFGRNYLEVGFYTEILFPKSRYALLQSITAWTVTSCRITTSPRFST